LPIIVHYQLNFSIKNYHERRICAEDQPCLWNWLFSSPTSLLANIGTGMKEFERGKEADIVAVLADEERGGQSQL